MSDKSIILKRLSIRAKESTNPKLLDQVNDEFFISALKKVADVSNKLGFNLMLAEKHTNFFDEINLKISRALMANYISIYYVDINTGEYIGYSGSKTYGLLKIEEKGTNFFEDSLKNIENVIYEEDRPLMREAMKKENILKDVLNGKHHEVNYRLVINGEPTYVSLKALKLAENDTNMIVGVRNMDVQTKSEIQAKREMDQSVTYTNIALALAKNFVSIYYVNTETNAYIEYNLDSEAQTLEEVSSGPNFFAESIVNAKKLVYKDDLDKFLNALDRDNLLSTLKTKKTFRLTYRLINNGANTYMSLVALNLIQDSTHILVGVSNIDEQKRKEKELEYEKSIARTDGLTGANNKFSYLETEDVYNNRIRSSSDLKFAVVVCDINNLKVINDTQGHVAGDRLIKDAKLLLSSIFTNSSVYRVGGDEFAILLEGKDYDNRFELVKKLDETNKKNKDTGEVVIAVGLSDYNKDTDYVLQDVFARADTLMYKNKDELKK